MYLYGMEDRAQLTVLLSSAMVVVADILSGAAPLPPCKCHQLSGISMYPCHLRPVVVMYFDYLLAHVPFSSFSLVSDCGDVDHLDLLVKCS